MDSPLSLSGACRRRLLIWATARCTCRWRFIAVLVALALTTPPAIPHAGASTRPFVLPIPPGQTWYVCQGYNAQLTHAATVALDLSLERRSAGSRGCTAGSKYSSAGSVVSSPAAGSAFRWPGCCGDDFVCVNLDSGGSVALGHLSNRIASGTRVATGARVGTVAWPQASNGDYAHIHVQAHPVAGCTEGSDPVAFDVAHGFKWACTPDLPYSGAVNQYSGLAVSRCAGADTGERQAVAAVEDDEPPTTSWFMSWLVRSMEGLVALLGGDR